MGINTDIFIYTIKSCFDSHFFHDRWNEKINKGEGNSCKVLKNHVLLSSSVASLMQALQSRTCITIHLSFAIWSHKSILHSLRIWASLYLCYEDVLEGKRMKTALQLQTNQSDCIKTILMLSKMNVETETGTEITMGSRHIERLIITHIWKRKAQEEGLFSSLSRQFRKKENYIMFSMD